MPVLDTDKQRYFQLMKEIVDDLGSFQFDRDTILWHYTDGAGLLGIIESGTIYSTQVSCLNDSSEIRYGSSLLQAALTKLISKYADNVEAGEFLQTALGFFKEDPEFPSNTPMKYFVACFSEEGDDLSQWRTYSGGENGYAIGFRASGLFGVGNALIKVNYDRGKHETLADKVAEATVRFFLEGLEAKCSDSPKQWGLEFLQEWDEHLTHIAPMIKDPGFKSEREFRIIHELNIGEFSRLRFVQKKTLMARHLPLPLISLSETRLPKFPIAGVRVGPCRHPAITRVSVDTFLRQMGYGTGLVSNSACPYRQT